MSGVCIALVRVCVCACAGLQLQWRAESGAHCEYDMQLKRERERGECRRESLKLCLESAHFRYELIVSIKSECFFLFCIFDGTKSIYYVS